MDAELYFDACRLLAGKLTQEQVGALEHVRRALMAEKVPVRHASYIIATAWHESRFSNVRETFAKSDRHAVARLNRRYKSKVGTKRCYWCRDKETGQHYYGRGIICQLTWRVNYEKMQELTGWNLVKDPDLALVPRNAAIIGVVGMLEGVFTGKKLSDYRSYYHMRKVVNGTDKAKVIAGYAKTVENLIGLAIDKGDTAPTWPTKPEIPEIVAPPEAMKKIVPESLTLRVNGVKMTYNFLGIEAVKASFTSNPHAERLKIDALDDEPTEEKRKMAILKANFAPKPYSERFKIDAIDSKTEEMKMDNDNMYEVQGKERKFEAEPRRATRDDVADAVKESAKPLEKSAFMSLTIWGVAVGMITTVVPPLLTQLGYSDWAVAIKNQDYLALIQLAASAMVVVGRQRAVAKLRWPRISF